MTRQTPRRRPHRLLGWDYGAAATYFCTLCTKERQPLLGQIMEGAMCLSAIGELVDSALAELQVERPDVLVDAYVIMPNHVHLLVSLVGDALVRTCGNSLAPPSGSLGWYIGRLKAIVAARARRAGLIGGQSLWQRGFHDHVVRNDREYAAITAYIEGNPANWMNDHENLAP
jgi:REP element-mobilizing transposase RayT